MEITNLVPFAHNWNVGTMENWNIGFWETAAVVYWQNSIDKEVNKMRNFHVRSSFQYSIIPGARQYATASKNSFNFNML